MTLHSEFKDMMLDTILAGGDDELDPSEEITYRPSGGTPRTIRAVVTRETGRYGETRTPSIIIRVANDGTDGISSTEINLGADQVDVPERPGETAATRNVKRPIIMNPAFLKLELM